MRKSVRSLVARAARRFTPAKLAAPWVYEIARPSRFTVRAGEYEIATLTRISGAEVLAIRRAAMARTGCA